MDRNVFHIEYQKALTGCVAEYKLTPKEPMSSEKECLDQSEPGLASALSSLAGQDIPVKWSYHMEVEFRRSNPDGDLIYKKAMFTSEDQAQDNVDIGRLGELIARVRSGIVSKIDKYAKDGSGWILNSVNNITFQFFRVILRRGGAAVVLPDNLKNKQCIINLDTNSCFKWAVISALHHKDVTHCNRVTEYSQWEDEFIFPINPISNAADVVEFVKTNKLPVYTHIWGKGMPECTYRPPRSLAINKSRVHLLLYKSHWMAITNLSRLYRTSTKAYFQMCDCCLSTFHKK